jgi:hypothetical protein
MIILMPHILRMFFSVVRPVLFCRRSGWICPLDGIHDKKPEKYVYRAAHRPARLVSHQIIAPQKEAHSCPESLITP